MIRQATLFALSLAGGAATCAEPLPELIRWQVLDVPPAFHFINGRPPREAGELGHGEIDGFMRLLIAQMPQHRHQFVEAGMARFEAMARQGQALCSLLLVRTPQRLDWLYFTPVYPPLMSRQLHVIVRRDRLEKFSSPRGQALQLQGILKRRDLVGLLQKDRAYGPRVDALLKAQGADGPKLMVLARNTQLLGMLAAGRMDYTLEHPPVLREFLRKDGASAELVALPIAEGSTTSMVHAACSRNAEGRRAIEAIDQGERQLALDPQRHKLLRSWRSDGLDEVDRKRLHHFMDERARAGARIE